jgi:hypothetical protein
MDEEIAVRTAWSITEKMVEILGFAVDNWPNPALFPDTPFNGLMMNEAEFQWKTFDRLWQKRERLIS